MGVNAGISEAGDAVIMVASSRSVEERLHSGLEHRHP